MYVQTLKCALLFSAFFTTSPQLNAEEKKHIFPPLLKEMPTYTVNIIPSPNLPHPPLQLTKKALRVLPSYFAHTNTVANYSAKIPSSLNRIRLEQIENNSYCNESLKLCWPKNIEVVADYLIVTYHSGETIYYQDKQKLSTFLWNETRQPIQNLMHKKAQR
jgi:hypothetical protein